MKKLLLTSAILASSLISFAQTPAVPNADFEDWSTGDCGDKPTDYTTYSELIKIVIGDCPSPTGITKSTNKYSGTYALQLTSVVYNYNAGSFVIPVNAGNSATLAVPFDGRPTKLIGYTKFTKAGTDTLGIVVDISDADDELIGYGDLTLSTTQSEYTRFEITLNYNTTNTNDVAMLIIDLGIGNEDELSSPNTIALIDGLSFEYATTTSNVNFTSTSPINVYAANKNINFSENVSEVHVVDMVGSQKMQEASTTKTLNAASLTAGMYIVTYKFNDAYYSKKVVIE